MEPEIVYIVQVYDGFHYTYAVYADKQQAHRSATTAVLKFIHKTTTRALAHCSQDDTEIYLSGRYNLTQDVYEQEAVFNAACSYLHVKHFPQAPTPRVDIHVCTLDKSIASL